MKHLSRLLLGAAISGPLLAAPLFPPKDEGHWAHDAMVRLSSQGLIENYPDGTFKGDRAATRYEVALIVARLLQKEEADQAKFATKAQLQTLHELASQLREELAALGVRVTQLEGQTALIDQRVQELERIQFYGSFEARVIDQAFTNQGASDNDDQRGGKGTKGVPFLDYNNSVGSSIGPTFRPQVQGVLPVVDYRNGRALVNGAGFTALARLGLKIRLDADNDAGLEIAGFSSQGNNLVDAYWGVSAPYLANAWTANNGVAGENNAPFSRVVFDHAWYVHKPSKTKVTLGYFDSLRMDPFIYAGQGNNNAWGPARFPGFGFQVLGQFEPGTDQEVKWEVFGSRFGDGGNLYQATNYGHVVGGADLAYKWGNADLKLNWVRYYDDSPGQSGPLTGLDNITNVAYLNSPGWTQTQWVNPPGFFANQRSAQEIANTGAVSGIFNPNLIDTRPIAGWNGGADNAAGITSGAGNFGAQSQNVYGGSAHYWIPMEGKEGVRLTGEYGHSDYKPNRNSSYVSKGNLARLEVAGVLAEGDLNVSLGYMRVDPNYAPALFNAALLGIRFPRPFNFMGRYNLYDSGNYPQNREGFLFKGNYKWGSQDEHFLLTWKAGLWQQTQTSLYDVRVLGGSLGPAIPTNDVIGFSPGFYDTIFSGYAHPNIYGPNSGNSFDANLNPLENPRGKVQELGMSFQYKIDDPNVTVNFGLERNDYRRNSGLNPNQGGSQNQVNLKTDYLNLGLNWGVTSDLNLRGGTEWVHVYGHHDPGGLYNGYARATGQTSFTNLDSSQWVPYIGLDKQLSSNTSVSVDFRYYITRDGVDSSVYAGSGSGAIGYTANPFNWSGPQISSSYKMTF